MKESKEVMEREVQEIWAPIQWCATVSANCLSATCQLAALLQVFFLAWPRRKEWWRYELAEEGGY